FAAAECPETTDQTCRLSALGARKSVCLVEYEEVQPCVRKQAGVVLPRQQQLKLFDVGEKDPRLAPGCSHHFARADLFGWVDAFTVLLLLERRQIVRARGTSLQSKACHFGLSVWCLAHVHTERDACRGQERTQSSELVFG